MKKFLFAIIALITIGFGSCKKDSATAEAYLRFVNLSPNAAPMDLKINDALLVGNVGFGAASSYVKTSGGSINASITPTGSTTGTLAGTITLTANSYNSLFIYDSVAKGQVALIADDRTAPPSGKVNIRFLNLVNGNVSVDVLRAGTTKLFSSRTYNDYLLNSTLTSYTAFDPGPFSVSVVIAGSSVLLTSLPSIDATAGKSYTLVFKGFLGGSGTQVVSLAVIADN
jgi:hypothetical protein